MGTSSIFDGNNDRNPLIPDDYTPDSQDESNVSWQTVKTNMSKYVTSGGTKGSVKKLLRDYVRASGGARQIAASATSGLNAAHNVGTFLSDIAVTGIIPTLTNHGIQVEGKSIHEVFSQLLNHLSPASSTKEDITARMATQAALKDLFDYIEKNDLDLDSLDNISQDLSDKCMKAFFTEYIWANFLKDLESRIETYMQDADSASNHEAELKDTIKAVVDVEYKKQNDLFNNIEEAARYLMERSLKTLEGII